MTHNHHNLSLAVLASTCALLAMPAGMAHAVDVGVSVTTGNAVSAEAGASLGAGSGIAADADASVGGSDGINADVSTDAGGGSGLDAGANARLGGSDGIDANATASIGRSSRVDANLALGGAEEQGGNRSAAYGTPNASEARIVELFRSRPVEEQRKMLVRCVDLSASGGGDSGLAGLCSLLQATASR
ncbi:hypothetical protein [Rhizobium croatiense]|uniref:Uncharacterized protein n=1 Tax=Rhizobium croatiense TaxID=2867516 RepID=A0ABS7LZX6_9HYPH|nr:hypothetical protein [Rhizobium croatiense]MBY4630308.1 hypothetical protein [Rhizobium croatiense]